MFETECPVAALPSNFIKLTAESSRGAARRLPEPRNKLDVQLVLEYRAGPSRGDGNSKGFGNVVARVVSPIPSGSSRLLQDPNCGGKSPLAGLVLADDRDSALLVNRDVSTSCNDDPGRLTLVQLHAVKKKISELNLLHHVPIVTIVV